MIKHSQIEPFDTITKSYKNYIVLLSQSGTNAPIPIVLENDLGGLPSYTYSFEGGYVINLAGAFTQDKTDIIPIIGDSVASIKAQWINIGQIQLITQVATTGVLTNGLMDKTHTRVEIKVYN